MIDWPRRTILAPIFTSRARSVADHCATSAGRLTLIATAAWHPMTKESLGNRPHEACTVAAVPGSTRGLRKAAAMRLANNGTTVAQRDAIIGWTDGKMASLCARKPTVPSWRATPFGRSEAD